MQPLTVSVKEKGGNPDKKPYPHPYGLRIHTETLSLRTLNITVCPGYRYKVPNSNNKKVPNNKVPNALNS